MNQWYALYVLQYSYHPTENIIIVILQYNDDIWWNFYLDWAAEK